MEPEAPRDVACPKVGARLLGLGEELESGRLPVDVAAVFDSRNKHFVICGVVHEHQQDQKRRKQMESRRG